MTLIKPTGLRVVGAAVAIAAATLAVRDYRAWKALGEGGIPWGLRGWSKVSYLRLIKGDALDVSGFDVGEEHPLLADLPERTGPRPRIGPHPVPHRQLDQEPGTEMLDALAEVFEGARASRPGDVEERESQYERLHPALYAPALADRGLSGSGEIAHFHRPQGSLHVHLNPDDARLVVERGWGELHGLSGRMLPATYTLVYAPRDDTELDVVRRILEATLDWATGPAGPDPVLAD